MRFLKEVVLGVAIFTGNVIAGMAELEAILPTCAVSRPLVLPLFQMNREILT